MVLDLPHRSLGNALGIFSRMLPLESLFRELNERGGRYVVVGGLAVVLHGHLRATGDVDLVIDLARDQVDRTLDALEGAGFRPYVPVPASDFADPAKRAAWVREKGMLVTLRGVPVRLASIDDLIGLKRMAGRPEDLTDVEALGEIKRLRAEGQ